MLGNSLIKTHDTNTVKYILHHYCTALANRRYVIDRH